MSEVGLALPILIALGAFLIGSIPFGLIIGRLFYRTDIRSQGSGNIGAMNALRTLGKGGAVAVLLLDALKGFVPTILVVWLLGDQLLGSLVATAAVLGHCFSPWLRLRGGKGVATSFGAIFALCWPAGLIAVAGWLLGALVTRYSSVGSLLGSIAAPVAIWAFSASLVETLYGVVAALLIVFTHRQNIARLRAGTEGPIRLIKRGA
ncbi:MAG: glycerol-3-phosphate 1-O-acyltransferase PlsY [Candidatus Eremiobacteraeota bacterium]|nr:glycerol-3-phosphate 1-O-acyltransferase PlsY [Candidatus Eremiobacteraeota bacterium]MBV9699097.1 glycerol-3-phosphate 1-O-acyltransferase PlsY [Candidatus Eremiobacteraeota bacterium]